MKLVAIEQQRSGKNIQFVTDEFKNYTLTQLLKQKEIIPLENVTVIEQKSGDKYLRSKQNSDKSDNLDEIAITCNIGDYLIFDRKYLYLKALNGRSKRKWKAFSGKQESTTNDQNKVEYGPLPEGEYIVHFEKTIDYENNEGLWDAVKWRMKKSRWGYVATPLEQVKGESFNRGNFYIHGGTSIGTEGCIEINDERNRDFHSFLVLYSRPFKLIVKYQ